MPLTAVNFVTKGPVLHADMLQFFNLFTGVMVDQPVTFKNMLTLGGSQGSTTVPLKVYGAVGQTGHLLDLYTDNTNANPGWGIAAAGQMGWGPGGAAPIDTNLSRVALQNGHATDTAGLLVSPYLEITGVMALDGSISWKTSSASIQQGAAGSLALTINQDLTARNVTLTGALGGNAVVSNANLGPDVARASLLTNGGFEIWQRGNGPFVQPGVAWCADRWGMFSNGTDTLSVSKDTTNKDGSSLTCAATTFTLGTGGGASCLYQQLKVGDGQQIAGATFSFSARVRTSVANAVRLGLATDGTGGPGTVYSPYVVGDGAYHTLTVTFTTVPTNATFVTCGIYFAASCTAYVDNASLVVGSQPANYVPLHPADDLARCLRYYEIIGETTNEINLYGYQGAGGAFGTVTPFKARKAVSPTVTKNGTWGSVNAGQPTVASSGVGVVSWYAIATAAGQANTNNNAAGANFTVEANP